MQNKGPTSASEQRRIVAYLDGLLAKVNAFPLALLGDDVRELQSQSQEELDALLPSVPWRVCAAAIPCSRRLLRHRSQ